MSRKDSALPLGAYETALTRRVHERLAATASANPDARFAIAQVDEELRERYTDAIVRTLSDHLARSLLSTHDPEQRVTVINSLAALIDPDDRIETEQLLHAVYEASLGEPPSIHPTPITAANLLTNASNEHSMSAEIKREIQTADRVDLVCAFIKNSGISAIREELEYLRDHSIPLRVITSTYCGASDVQAIDRLVEEFGADVKIGYESQQTRLHAKAWLFRRKSGFDSAFIGSSNLSNSALIDGIEWNVRTSRRATPVIISKFEAVFDTYWNDVHFVPYTPSQDRRRLEVSLQRASNFGKDSRTELELSGLRVEPYPYQESMLDALEAERAIHDRHRNLLIAATGTGKTVVAALDYRRLAESWKKKPTLLFVAHRTQLLRQAMRTYREVLRDPTFGELFDGHHAPRIGTHVFATIQSLSRVLDGFSSEHFEVVVIDEFHHAQASTYQHLLDHVSPRELLGLTATPERGDGVNVQKFFDYRVAYELRLWDALALGLVAPMHYYGINDETDLTGITWSRSSKAYNTAELSEFYINQGDSRVRLILNELERRVFDLSSLKALGFCVSIDHANYMAERFRAHGLPAAAITSRTPDHERDALIDDLRDGTLKVLFTVDLFNEGVDIPEVNALLLLRPTESPIVYLQQLGRGLRKQPGKVCTVLDFLGMQHKEFSFEARFLALTGKRGKHLEREIDQGFPSLPGGTQIRLDRVTHERVLHNVKRLATPTITRIRSLAQQEQTTDLSAFLANTGLDLHDLYRSKNGGWTRILRSQNLIPAPDPAPADEDFLLRRLRSLLHVNDEERARMYLALADPDGRDPANFSRIEESFSQMLVTHIWGNQNTVRAPSSVADGIVRIRRVPSFVSELRQVFRYNLDRTRNKPEPVAGHEDLVLRTHADYSIAELTAALRRAPLPALLNIPREGVKHIPEAHADIFFVTLVKDHGFTETTSYKDFPITRDLFQWESQSTTSLSSKTGQRYIHHKDMGSTVFLCVRNLASSSIDTANAFTFLGNVVYADHSGEKPIRFEWKLTRPMPATLYQQGRAVV